MWEDEFTNIKEEPVEDRNGHHWHIPFAQYEENPTIMEAYNDPQLQPTVVMKRLSDACYSDLELTVHFGAKNCIKDEECIHLSAECNPRDGEDVRDSIHPHGNELPNSSERAQNSHSKMLLASDTVLSNTAAITVTKHEFFGTCNSRGTFRCVNTEETLLAVPQMTDDAAEPARHDIVVSKHQFVESGISQGSYRSENRENTLVEIPEMSDIAVSDSKLQCKVCGNRFKKQRYLERHMTIHTGEKPYKCSFCDKKFRVKCAHTLHELVHKGELPQCPVCGGRYVSLQAHLLIHSTDRYKHVCSVCGRAFCRAGHLKRHMLVHTGERPYTCQDCGGQFRSINNLKSHIRAVHTVEEKNHVCSVCAKMFSRGFLLNAHMRIYHTDQKTYQCETCGKDFKIKANLERHQTIHSLERRFACSTCGKCFRVDSALRRHKLIHTGEQPYECSVCRMRFNQSNSMNRHMLTHTGEKPYSCSDCGTRFTQSGGLASHRLRHCPNSRNINS